jgi:hypothetical protein
VQVPPRRAGRHGAEKLQQLDALLAERIGHRGRGGLRPRQAHEPARGARGEVEPLLDVALEALEAELSVELAIDHLLEHASNLQIHLLKERNGPPETAVQPARRAAVEALRQSLERISRPCARTPASPAQVGPGTRPQSRLISGLRRAPLLPALGHTRSDTP